MYPVSVIVFASEEERPDKVIRGIWICQWKMGYCWNAKSEQALDPMPCPTYSAQARLNFSRRFYSCLSEFADDFN